MRFLVLVWSLISSCTTTTDDAAKQARLEKEREAFGDDLSLEGDKIIKKVEIKKPKLNLKPIGIVDASERKILEDKSLRKVEFAKCTRPRGIYEYEEGLQADLTLWLQGPKGKEQVKYFKQTISREKQIFLHLFGTVSGKITGENFTDEKRFQNYWAKKLTFSRLEVNENFQSVYTGALFVVVPNRMIAVRVGKNTIPIDECDFAPIFDGTWGL